MLRFPFSGVQLIFFLFSCFDFCFSACVCGNMIPADNFEENHDDDKVVYMSA